MLADIRRELLARTTISALMLDDGVGDHAIPFDADFADQPAHNPRPRSLSPEISNPEAYACDLLFSIRLKATFGLDCIEPAAHTFANWSGSKRDTL